MTLVLALVIGVAAYAFTATNVVPASNAGDGNAAIGDFTLSNITYTYNSRIPEYIDYWQFDLGAPASSVRSKIMSSSASYTACTNVSGTLWRCDPTDITISNSVDQLRVIAVGP